MVIDWAKNVSRGMSSPSVKRNAWRNFLPLTYLASHGEQAFTSRCLAAAQRKKKKEEASSPWWDFFSHCKEAADSSDSSDSSDSDDDCPQQKNDDVSMLPALHTLPTMT
eukprot:scaffold3155_cov97-Skeletonema_dohrnii-CCMP3373.AAC.11